MFDLRETLPAGLPFLGDTHDHDRSVALAGAVQFHEEDPLPAAQIDPTVDHVQALRAAQKDRPRMGITVDPFVRREGRLPDAEVVVTIVHLDLDPIRLDLPRTGLSVDSRFLSRLRGELQSTGTVIG